MKVLCNSRDELLSYLLIAKQKQTSIEENIEAIIKQTPIFSFIQQVLDMFITTQKRVKSLQ